MIIVFNRQTAFNAAIYVYVVSVLMGCAVQDRRMTADETSCRSMGHLPGTEPFKGCLKDLDDRRCVVARQKGTQSHHVASIDCTRLN